MKHDWDAVYDILVREAGADEDRRASFVAYEESGTLPTEWRFQGTLGFGGKLWNNGHGPIYVNCYREDETPARRETIARTNAALEKLSFGAPEEGAK